MITSARSSFIGWKNICIHVAETASRCPLVWPDFTSRVLLIICQQIKMNLKKKEKDRMAIWPEAIVTNSCEEPQKKKEEEKERCVS